jgi:hypothetical protein
MNDFLIERCDALPYLFNLSLSNGTVYHEITFEECQRVLGIEPEDFARVDDNRCLLIV